MTDPGNPKSYQSWGRYPKISANAIWPVFWRDELPDLTDVQLPVLPYAYGRSYGDSCLNEGVLLDVSYLNRFLAFDDQDGILRCEAGTSLAEILDIIVPKGWFLPVTPGTKFVSVGGAIANDVHGKNHHQAGTFGCHVRSFELVRSNDEHFICSRNENRGLFEATIGGLGLTGIILWAEIELKKISTPFIAMERVRFSTLEEFFDISELSDTDYEYTVAWVDCLASGKNLGRGIFIRGNHVNLEVADFKKEKKRQPVRIPCDFPAMALSGPVVKVFNECYYHSQLRKQQSKYIHYDAFFYPLDAVLQWNRIYGKRGFLQYQCVVPPDNEHDAVKKLLGIISDRGEGSFLVVLKKFGSIVSPGKLSFPQVGTTLALDFPFRGKSTLELLDNLDKTVVEHGGAVYPAKDARMSPENFRQFFPNWTEFSRYIDPKFGSHFWNRVTATISGNGYDQDTNPRSHVGNRTRNSEIVRS